MFDNLFSAVLLALVVALGGLAIETATRGNGADTVHAARRPAPAASATVVASVAP